MTENDFHYLKEVLGLSGIPLPSELKNKLHDFEVRPLFCVYTPFVLSEIEMEFTKKMLAAVEVNEVVYFNQKENSKEEILQFSQKHSRCFGISFGIAPPLSVHTHWVEFPAISQFLDLSDAKFLDKIKRHAWSELKRLKSEMSTPI